MLLKLNQIKRGVKNIELIYLLLNLITDKKTSLHSIMQVYLFRSELKSALW